MFGFCFTNILNILFSLVTCTATHSVILVISVERVTSAIDCIDCTCVYRVSLLVNWRTMHKIFRTTCLWTPPLEVLAPSVRVGQIHVHPPKKKRLRPYAYVMPNLAHRVFLGVLMRNNHNTKKQTEIKTNTNTNRSAIILVGQLHKIGEHVELLSGPSSIFYILYPFIGKSTWSFQQRHAFAL